MGKKSYKKGGTTINGVEQLNEETSTDDIKNEPGNEQMNKNAPMVNKDEAANNEPKKYVDPTGKEWCECPPPKTAFTRIESVKNFGKTTNEKIKKLQDDTINNVKNTLSSKKDEYKKKISDKALNFVGNIFGNKENVIEPTAQQTAGGRRRTRKHRHSKDKTHKHCKRKTHCKHRKSKHRKSKHRKSKHRKSKHRKSKHRKS